MPRTLRTSSKQNRSRKSGHANLAEPPSDLVSRLRGLYRRVAQQMGVDPSFVSRVARGERKSAAVYRALKAELRKIIGRLAEPGRSKQKSGRGKSRRQ